ncbi:hypothetical protein FACS1894125_5070 [Actinomycetota bacterium]|nr:hypothetical protein FACS1894125_5070 [Actinomycetota bacterium]
MHNDKNIKELNALLRKILAFTTILGLSCVLLAFFAGIPFLELLFGANLEGYQWQLTFMVIGGIFYQMSTFFVLLLTIMRKMVLQAVVFLSALVIEAVLGLWIVNVYDINGAVFLWIVANFILCTSFVIAYIYNIRRIND